MAEYTYKDVIIDPEDPRVELWEEYYFGRTPFECLCLARGDKAELLKTVSKNADKPFSYSVDFSRCFPCIIRKKEPDKKYVPFDLSREEDRARLRGAWVRKKEAPFLEQEIAGLATNVALVFLNDVVSVGVANLLEEYEFVDGTPCGKLVEEE